MCTAFLEHTASLSKNVPLEEVLPILRIQFTLRSVLTAALGLALYLGMAQTAGYAVAAGIVVAISVVIWAVAWRRRRAFLYSRIGAAVFSLVAIWFLAVDWSWFVADCPDCRHGRDIAQYRVLGIRVHTQVQTWPTMAQLILEDIGAPCEHANCEPWHKYRCWGLVLPACPHINGIVRLTDDPDDYTDDFAAKVRRLGAENPQLAAELHDLVVRNHDYQTFWKTIKDRTGYPPDNVEQ